MYREDEGQRVDEVGCDPAQDRPLVEGLEDEPEVAMLEVAQAPVHQAARP